MPLESLFIMRPAMGCKVGESHHLRDAARALRAAVAEGAGVEIQVLEHGHVFVRAEGVGHPAEAGAGAGRDS